MRYIARLKYIINRALHLRACASILHTPPTRVYETGPTVVSMVGSSQVLMYLCAIKTFAQHIHASGYAVLDDGSLADEDRKVIRRQVEGVKIFHIDEVDTGTAPRGGCWERLLLISELNKQNYVIQLDSDTLTIGAIPEVVACTSNGKAFTLITSATSEFVSLREAASRARALTGDHLQFVAERALDRLPDPDRGRYVRGCAAFAGFPPRTADRSSILKFSETMQSALGARWSEWGTEQVTSNWVIANAYSIGRLPFPRYRNYDPCPVTSETAFLHFIGTTRHADQRYTRLTRALIERMAVAK